MRASLAVAIALVFWAFGVSAEAQKSRLTVLSVLGLSPDLQGFGGISGFELDTRGEAFKMVSDDGLLYEGALSRGPDASLSAARIERVVPLFMENGQHPNRKWKRDIEGLVWTGGNAFHVVTENMHRLLSYPSANTKPARHNLPFLPAHAPKNRGFEALALDQAGTFYALPEWSANLRTGFPLYQLGSDKAWTSIFTLPRHGNFRPVGADFGPDGHLYVLLRAFSGMGFTSRVTRILFADGQPSDSEVLFTSSSGEFDNLEALSIWQTNAGDIRLVAISDDNFSRFQTTQIVEFGLKE